MYELVKSRRKGVLDLEMSVGTNKIVENNLELIGDGLHISMTRNTTIADVILVL